MARYRRLLGSTIPSRRPARVRPGRISADPPSRPQAVGILHHTMWRPLKPRVLAPSAPGRAKNAWKTPRRDVSARDVVRPEVFRRRDGPRSWACVEPEPGAAPRRHEPDPIANMDKLSKLHPIRPPRRRRSCPPPSACGPRRSWPTYYAPAPMSPRLHRPGPVVTRSRVIDPIVNSLFTTRSRLVAPTVLSDNTVVGASFDGSRFPPLDLMSDCVVSGSLGSGWPLDPELPFSSSRLSWL